MQALLKRGGEAKGDSSIEQISHVYGKQAVVVSVDPRRVSDACCGGRAAFGALRKRMRMVEPIFVRGV